MELIDRGKAMNLIARIDDPALRYMDQRSRSAYAAGIARALAVLQSMDSIHLPEPTTEEGLDG